MKHHFHCVLLLALSCLYGFASSAPVVAQTCIPNAIGVPGQPGPPTWWSGSGAIDDPRWQGSMSFGHSGDGAQFRALRYTEAGQTYVVLSWQVKTDSGLSGGTADYLHVGFWDETANRGNIIKITRTATTSVADGTSAGGQLTAQMRFRDGTTGGQWNPISTLPPVTPWITADARLGTNCGGGLCTQWNIRLRIPISGTAVVSNPTAGLPLPASFRMWHELHVENAGGTLALYKWPEAAADVVDLPLTFPDPTTWAPVSLGSPCAPGVWLEHAQITTDNSDSTAISTVHPNVFHARPRNDSGAPIGGDQIKARFRIANWGSVLFDSPEWIDIDPSSPSCAAATGGAGNVASGSNFDLTCTWDLTAEQKCAYQPTVYTGCTPMPTPRHDHQCILVELSSSAGVLFSRSSSWNNMHFVNTSRHEEKAAVSIKGLPPLASGPTRDVYLYLTTHNLPLAPDHGDGEQGDGAPSGQGERAEGARENRKPPKTFMPVGTKEAARLQELVRQGELTSDDLVARMPTYLVKVFYDTGKRVTENGTEYTVIEPMPSFGYYVMHDGEITGWNYSLSAANAVPIAPNFWKIPVNHDATVEVTTVVESVEVEPHQPPVPPTKPWWLWLAIALGLLIALLLWLRSRRP